MAAPPQMVRVAMACVLTLLGEKATDWYVMVGYVGCVYVCEGRGGLEVPPTLNPR